MIRQRISLDPYLISRPTVSPLVVNNNNRHSSNLVTNDPEARATTTMDAKALPTKAQPKARVKVKAKDNHKVNEARAIPAATRDSNKTTVEEVGKVDNDRVGMKVREAAVASGLVKLFLHHSLYNLGSLGLVWVFDLYILLSFRSFAINSKARRTRGFLPLAYRFSSIRCCNWVRWSLLDFAAFLFVPYDFLSLSFSMPVSGRTMSSGPQKFSDFESDIMTGWVGAWAFGWSHSHEWLPGLGYVFKKGMAGWRRQRALFACF